ncbi:MAG: stage III sporulation protein AF, partial [Bacillota bacterium]
GQIKEIRLVVKKAPPAGRGENALIGPVKIQVGTQKPDETGKAGREQTQIQSSALPEEVKSKLKTTLATFYNISPEQVKVSEGN